MAPGSVREWARRGCPHDGGGPKGAYTFDLEEVDAWLGQNNRKGSYAQPLGSSSGGPEQAVGPLSEELDKAKLRKELALAEKHEIDLEERRGELLPRAAVERERLARIAAVKGALLAMPGQYAARWASINDPGAMEREIAAAVEVLLREFSRAG